MSRPQHSKAGRLRLAPVAIALGAVVTLTGCAAGKQAETADETATVYGDNVSTQNMYVRDATLAYPEGEPVYPAGSTAPVQAVLINQKPQQDRLLSVSSPYANSTEIGEPTVIPGGTRLYVGRETATTGQPDTQTQFAQNGPVQKKRVEIRLVGFTQPIRPGVTIPVTFTFAQAGSVTAQVPIGPSPEPRPEQGSPDTAEQIQEPGQGSGQGHGG
ncbi:hypothetical protein DFQ14_11227 [Halopolyspora algeriensis]|uniref:Copper(I)-binding protein n=1 Tax=Halopolyspora algeriensis TaxID=1500506 RepID=A0A368VFX5_9ACTN|nr:copper chaperone PCu(A)C [Halopolyspora algeriensis]RCW40148.1 hypothetical protein DFQ14_11227 [Halopolyspora algeriensis]TQM46370.1 hypothetical protein FHU43_4043 [Halopolyspora algeriensis]